MKSTKTKTTGKNKSSQKKPYSNRESETVPPLFGFFKPRQNVVLKYADNIATGAIATGATGVQVFRLNSLFDPDRTGTGHQPFGRDTLAALFNRYRVNSCDWEISFVPFGTGYNFGVVPYNGSFPVANTIADLQLLQENPRSVYGMIGTTGEQIKLRGKVNLPQLNGVTSQIYEADDRFQADQGSNPTEVMDLNIVVYNPNVASLALTYNVVLMYHATVYDPILPGLS